MKMTIILATESVHRLVGVIIPVIDQVNELQGWFFIAMDGISLSWLYDQLINWLTRHKENNLHCKEKIQPTLAVASRGRARNRNWTDTTMTQIHKLPGREGRWHLALLFFPDTERKNFLPENRCVAKLQMIITIHLNRTRMWKMWEHIVT